MSRAAGRPPRLCTPFAVREALVHVCRRLSDRGLIAGQDGNVSLRVGADRLLVTPAGFAKGSLDVDDLVEVSLSGAHLAGRERASSELGLHLAAYAARPDVMAVVHAHPVTATAFTLVGETVPDGVLAELMLTVGTVGLAPYAQPGTDELGRVVTPFFRTHDVVLLAHHGAVSLGRSLQDAHFAMESLEHGARMIHLARQLGRVVTLEGTACDALRAARRGARTDAAPGVAHQEIKG
ncbi:MAG: class II aldolase/adducin family protein [Gemmatimonadaceae bacterium]|nr:class II aldolase/adducin family protein [Gemmatimonadaceae bacterium]